MARIVCKAALALLLWIAGSVDGVSLIDGNGAVLINGSSSLEEDGKGKGIVALLTSPMTSSTNSPLELTTLIGSNNNNNSLLITSPGATSTGGSALSKGNGAAAAGLLSGCIVISDITTSDLENGLDDTRHGKTLLQLFSTRLESTDTQTSTPTKLILAIPPSSCTEESIQQNVEAIFDSAVAGMEQDDSSTKTPTLQDLYTVEIITVETDSDMNKVLEKAAEEASKSPYGGDISVASAITNVYNKLNSNTSDNMKQPPSIAAALLACDDAYARQSKSVRAKLASWKSRVLLRNLWVDKFGTQASDLIKSTLESYDRDTLAAAGLLTTGPYRMDLRTKLQRRLESSILELYNAQVKNVEKSELTKFESLLLQKWKNREDKTVGTATFYKDNATLLRTAAFSFDSILSDLVLPSSYLSTPKSKASLDFQKTLDATLLSFPDSPAARLSGLKQVNRAVQKQKKPTEKSVDIGLDLVAMIRPDGYGTLQGFAGYQLGGNNIICGFANDADSPEVISQFGGVRPPFVRIQPKLKVDVEL